MSETLTPRQDTFVREYLVDLNATQAAVRAGYSAKTANREGARLLSNAVIQRALQVAQAKRAERTEITADAVLRQWWTLANADPNELVEYRRTCCRHCWGEDFRYQFTQREYDDRVEEARRMWEKKAPKPVAKTSARPLSIAPKVEFDESQVDALGGVGFHATKDPNSECPNCFGEGVERVYLHDTRKLSPAARRLYAGVKQTKEGLEVKMHDQFAALNKVAEHLGMFRPDAGAVDPADVAKAVRDAIRESDKAEGIAA